METIIKCSQCGEKAARIGVVEDVNGGVVISGYQEGSGRMDLHGSDYNAVWCAVHGRPVFTEFGRLLVHHRDSPGKSFRMVCGPQ